MKYQIKAINTETKYEMVMSIPVFQEKEEADSFIDWLLTISNPVARYEVVESEVI